MMRRECEQNERKRRRNTLNASWEFNTVCQVNLFAVSEQYYNSVNLLLYSIILLISSNSLLNLSNHLLLFSVFHLQGDSGCQNDYLEIREGSSTGHVVGCYSGNTLPSNYTSVIGHILWVKFVSDASVSGAGFRATFSHCEYLCVSLASIAKTVVEAVVEAIDVTVY